MELSKGQIKTLETVLKESLQDSLTTYIPLRLIRKGLLEGYTVWADRWPEFSAVVLSPDKAVVKNAFLQKKVFIYCRGPREHLHDLLNKEGIIQWETVFKLNGVSREVFDTADKIFGNLPSTFTSRLDAHCYLYKVTEDTLQKIEKPEGMIEGYMTPDIADYIAKAWKFQQDGVGDYIRVLLSMNQLNVCLYTNDGIPVAWSIEQIHGTNGMLFVDERYRRLGLGQYIQYVLSKNIIKRDGCAFVAIETDNYISVSLHEKVGFQKVQDTDLIWYEYSPNILSVEQ